MITAKRDWLGTGSDLPKAEVGEQAPGMGMRPEIALPRATPADAAGGVAFAMSLES